jgi:carboxyl-terminal processing protease
VAPGYGYLRITQFSNEASKEVETALTSLEEAGALRDGLILDIRDNSGGLLNAAVRTADFFLETGLIVHSRARSDNRDEKFFAHVPKTWTGFRLVVLVNGATAAGSEVLAAALRYHTSAIIVGTQTKGHGTVQTIVPIGSDRALRLTTSRMYSADGRAIALGIEPDIVMESDPVGTSDRTSDALVGRALQLLGYGTSREGRT